MLRNNSTSCSLLVSTPEFLTACKAETTLFHWCYGKHLQIYILFKAVMLGLDANLQFGFMFEELWVFWRLYSSMALSNFPPKHKRLLQNWEQFKTSWENAAVQTPRDIWQRAILCQHLTLAFKEHRAEFGFQYYPIVPWRLKDFPFLTPLWRPAEGILLSVMELDAQQILYQRCYCPDHL